MKKSAEFSACGLYRYQLARIWDEGKKVAMTIGLNPSRAGATDDDNTISILCIALEHLGYGGFKMVNLYGLITPKPQDLISHHDPIGANDAWVHSTAYGCQDIIFCWGAFKQAKKRASAFEQIFSDAKCFGKNADGSPWHPRALNYTKGAIRDKVELMPFLVD